MIVTKGQSVETIRALYEHGEREFGENRAQELAIKVDQLPDDIRWHFVGPLQSNKVRIVRPSVKLLHSLDRPELGPAWIKGPGLAPPALLQVNIGARAPKARRRSRRRRSGSSANSSRSGSIWSG